MPFPESFQRTVHTVGVDESAVDAARRMREERIGALVVLDDEQLPIGMVTDRDLALRVVGAQLDPATTPVRACMTSPLVTVHPSDDVAGAARKMRERLVRRLPIVDDDRRLIGLVVADDLVGSLGSALGALSAAPLQGFENENRPPPVPDSVFGKE
jgi:CBS domain-containing protein